jgi:hypothetical protein
MTRNIQDVFTNHLTQNLRKREYEALPQIAGHNAEPFSPITFSEAARLN